MDILNIKEFDDLNGQIDQIQNQNDQSITSLQQQINSIINNIRAPEKSKELASSLLGEIILIQSGLQNRRSLYELAKQVFQSQDPADDGLWRGMLDTNNNQIVDVADGILQTDATKFVSAFDRLKGEITRKSTTPIVMTADDVAENVFILSENGSDMATRIVQVKPDAVGMFIDLNGPNVATQATLEGSFLGTIIGRQITIDSKGTGPVNAFFHAQGHGNGIGATTNIKLSSNQNNAINVVGRGGEIDVGGGKLALIDSGSSAQVPYSIDNASQVYLAPFVPNQTVSKSSISDQNGYDKYTTSAGGVIYVKQGIQVDISKTRSDLIFNDTKSLSGTDTGVVINESPHDVQIFKNGQNILTANDILQIPNIPLKTTSNQLPPLPNQVPQPSSLDTVNEDQRTKQVADMIDRASQLIHNVTLKKITTPNVAESYEVYDDGRLIGVISNNTDQSNPSNYIDQGDVTAFIDQYCGIPDTPTPTPPYTPTPIPTPTPTPPYNNADDADCNDCYPIDPDGKDDPTPDKITPTPPDLDRTKTGPVRLGNDYYNTQTPDMPESKLKLRQKYIFRKADVDYLLQTAKRFLPKEDFREARSAILDLKVVNRESAHRVMVEEINAGNKAADIRRDYMHNCNRYVPNGELGKREGRKLKALGSLMDSGDPDVRRLLGEAARVFATTDETRNRNKQGAKETLGVYQLVDETHTVTEMQIADTLSTRFGDDNYDSKVVVGPGTALPGGPQQLDYDDVHISDRRRARLIRKGKQDKLNRIMETKLSKKQARADKKFGRKAEAYVAKEKPDQGVLGGRQIKAGYQNAKHILRMQAIGAGKTNPETYASDTIARNIATMIMPHVSQSAEVQSALASVQNESDLLAFANHFPSVIPQIRMHFRTVTPREFEHMMIGGVEQAQKVTLERISGTQEALTDYNQYVTSSYGEVIDSDPVFQHTLDQKFQECASSFDVSEYDPAIVPQLQQSLTDIRRSPSVYKAMRTQFLVNFQQDLRDNRPAQAQALQNITILEQNFHDFQANPQYAQYIQKVGKNPGDIVFTKNAPKDLLDTHQTRKDQYDANSALLGQHKFSLGDTRVGFGVSHSFFLSEWNKRVTNLNMGAGASIQTNGKNAQVGIFFGPSASRTMGRKDQNNFHMGFGVGIGRMVGHTKPVFGLYANIGTNLQTNLKKIEESLTQHSAHYVDIDLAVGINFADGKILPTPELYVGAHREKIKGLEQQKVAVFETLVKSGGVFDTLYNDIFKTEAKKDCPLTISAITGALRKLYPSEDGRFSLSQSAETLYHALLPFDTRLRDPQTSPNDRQLLREHLAQTVTNHMTANRMEQMNKLYFRGVQVPVIATTCGILALVGSSVATGGVTTLLGLTGAGVLGIAGAQTLLTSIGLVRKPVYTATAEGLQATQNNRIYGLGAQEIQVSHETLDARVAELNDQFSPGSESKAFQVYRDKDGQGIKINTKMIDPTDKTPNLRKINLHLTDAMLTSVRHENGRLIVPDTMSITHTLDNHQEFRDIIIGGASLANTKQIGISDLSKFDNPAFGPHNLTTTETVTTWGDVETMVSTLGDFKDKFAYSFDTNTGVMKIIGYKQGYTGPTYTSFPVTINPGQKLSLTLVDDNPGTSTPDESSIKSDIATGTAGKIEIDYTHTTYTKSTSTPSSTGTSTGASTGASSSPGYSSGSSTSGVDTSSYIHGSYTGSDGRKALQSGQHTLDQNSQLSEQYILLTDIELTSELGQVGKNALDGVYDPQIKEAKSPFLKSSYTNFRDAMEKQDYNNAIKRAKTLINVPDETTISQYDLFAIQNACNYLAGTQNMRNPSQVKEEVTRREGGLKKRILNENYEYNDPGSGISKHLLRRELKALRDDHSNVDPAQVDRNTYKEALAFVFGYEKGVGSQVNEKFVLGTELISGSVKILDTNTHKNTIGYFLKNILDKGSLFDIMFGKHLKSVGVEVGVLTPQQKRDILFTVLEDEDSEEKFVNIGGKEFCLTGKFFFGLNPKCFNETIGITELQIKTKETRIPPTPTPPSPPTPTPPSPTPYPIPHENYTPTDNKKTGSLSQQSSTIVKHCPPKFAYNTMAVDSSASAREGTVVAAGAAVSTKQKHIPVQTPLASTTIQGGTSEGTGVDTDIDGQTGDGTGTGGDGGEQGGGEGAGGVDGSTGIGDGSGGQGGDTGGGG